MDCAINQG
jgi:hypothetical protein